MMYFLSNNKNLNSKTFYYIFLFQLMCGNFDCLWENIIKINY